MFTSFLTSYMKTENKKYNVTNTGKEANAYLILYITMLPIFENTNFTAVDDFLRLTISNIHNSNWKIFSDI